MWHELHEYGVISMSAPQPVFLQTIVAAFLLVAAQSVSSEAKKPKVNVQELQGQADILVRKHKYHEAIPLFTKVLKEQAKNERLLLKVRHLDTHISS